MVLLRRVMAGGKEDVLYLVHPNAILEQSPHIGHVKPFIDKLRRVVGSFRGKVIVTVLDREFSEGAYTRREFKDGIGYVGEFMGWLKGKVDLIVEDSGDSSGLGRKAGRLLDDMYLEGRLGKVILGGCFLGAGMCIERTRGNLIREYGEDRVEVRGDISMKAGQVVTSTVNKSALVSLIQSVGADT